MSHTLTFSAQEVRALMSALCLSSSSGDVDRLRRVSSDLLDGPLGRKTKVPLPWTGVVVAGNCQGLRVNHDLFTQCVNAPADGGTFCKTCISTGAKNTTKPGTPLYGTVTDRQACDPKDYKVVVNGKEKKVASYAKIVAKLGLSEVVVRAVAESHSVTLPDDSFTLPVAKRSPKSAIDDEEPVVVAPASKTPASDLVAALVESAKDTAPSRTDIAKAKVADLKSWCTSYALQLGTKKEMQQRLRTELNYVDKPKPVEATVEATVEAPVEATVEAPVEAPVEVKVEPTVAESKSSLAVKPEDGVTDGVEEKKVSPTVTFKEPDTVYTGGGSEGLSAATSPSSELSEEDPLAQFVDGEVLADLFSDEKTGSQYLKDEEGRLYDVSIA